MHCVDNGPSHAAHVSSQGTQNAGAEEGEGQTDPFEHGALWRLLLHGKGGHEPSARSASLFQQLAQSCSPGPRHVLHVVAHGEHPGDRALFGQNKCCSTKGAHTGLVTISE